MTGLDRSGMVSKRLVAVAMRCDSGYAAKRLQVSALNRQGNTMRCCKLGTPRMWTGHEMYCIALHCIGDSGSGSSRNNVRSKRANSIEYNGGTSK